MYPIWTFEDYLTGKWYEDSRHLTWYGASKRAKQLAQENTTVINFYKRSKPEEEWRESYEIRW